MSTEPERKPSPIRVRIEALLAELPDGDELAALPAQADIDGLAQRLEQAHELLVRALESVEKG